MTATQYKEEFKGNERFQADIVVTVEPKGHYSDVSVTMTNIQYAPDSEGGNYFVSIPFATTSPAEALAEISKEEYETLGESELF